MKRHPIFLNSSINILTTIVSFLIAYAMTPVILHRLGNDAYGIWVFLGIFSISGYFSLLDLGLQGAAIKFVAEFFAKKDTDQLQKTISATLTIFLGMGACAGILLLIFNAYFLQNTFHIPFESQEVVHMLVNILALSFLFQFPALGFSAILEGIQRYDYLKGITLAAMLISNAYIYLFLKSDGGLSFVVMTGIVTSFVMMLLYAWATKKLLPDIRIWSWRIDRQVLQKLFSLSYKLFASKIVGLIFNNTDKILIAIFLTVAIQTDYDIVNKVHIIVLTALSMLNAAVLPATSELDAKKDTAGLQTLLLRGTKYATLLVIPLLIFFFLFSKDFISVWVGAEYGHLAPLVRLYIFHILFTMFVGISSTMLIGVNRVQEGLKISLWAAIINLVISTATVTTFGITGLITGTVIAYIISSIMYVVITNRVFHIPLKRFFREAVLPLFLPAAASITIFFGAKLLFDTTQLPAMIILMIGTYAIVTLLAYFFSLTADEQSIVHTLFTSRLKKKLLQSSIVRNTATLYVKFYIDNFFRKNSFLTFAKKITKIPHQKIEGSEKKIILFPTAFFLDRGLAWQTAIAKALEVRGHTVVFMPLDIRFPKRNGLYFDTHNGKFIVEYYKLYTKTLLKSFSFQIRWYSEFDVMNEYATHRVHLEKLSWEELRAYTYEDLPLGKIALNPLMHHFRCSAQRRNEEMTDAYRDYIAISIILCQTITRALDVLRPDIIYTLNGSFLDSALHIELAKRRGIRVITFEAGFMLNSLMLGVNESIISFPLSKYLPPEYQSYTLSPQQEAQLNTYLQTRSKGKDCVFDYWGNPIFDHEKIRTQLNIRAQSKPDILFTNLLWDSAMLDSDILFTSQQEWIIETIRYYEKHPEKQLLVRIHPAEEKPPELESMDKIMDMIHSVFHKLPKNVILIPPSSTISSYPLTEISNKILVYSSTAGLRAQ